jgi:hypothetical protein
VVGALVVLAALPGLAGCTPADKPAIALSNVGGRPTVLIVNCSDFAIDTVNVDAEADATAWSASTESAAGPDQVVLFEAPAGWTATERTLTDLKPGASYTITAFARAKRAVPIRFTVDQFDQLGADQVLAGDPGSTAEVVSDKKFREKAADAC